MDSLVLKSYDNLRLNPLQLLWFSYSKSCRAVNYKYQILFCSTLEWLAYGNIFAQINVKLFVICHRYEICWNIQFKV